MDHADSITYSVHDLEDFKRAGLIPLEKIARNEIYRQSFLDRWKADEPGDDAQKFFQESKNFQSIKNILDFCISDTADPGSEEDLEILEGFRSRAITHFLSGIKLSPSAPYALSLSQELTYQCKFLHRLVRDYVILSPRLATQQFGQVRIITNLEAFFREALEKRRVDRIPNRFRRRAKEILDLSVAPVGARYRLGIDIVASLSEAEAILLHKRIMGQHTGSILDPMN